VAFRGCLDTRKTGKGTCRPRIQAAPVPREENLLNVEGDDLEVSPEDVAKRAREVDKEIKKNFNTAWGSGADS